GVTSFMEMPNTVPNALTQDLLEEKYQIGAATSLANYSFYMGTSNNNADEVLRTNEKKESVCGVKIFLGASTGNMLVDNCLTVNRIFSESEMLITLHCEEEPIIKANYARLKAEKPELEPADHPIIRDVDACFESFVQSSAVGYAARYPPACAAYYHCPGVNVVYQHAATG
nr:hypothetical protein [Chitinophagaceae bacterium]